MPYLSAAIILIYRFNRVQFDGAPSKLIILGGPGGVGEGASDI